MSTVTVNSNANAKLLNEISNHETDITPSTFFSSFWWISSVILIIADIPILYGFMVAANNAYSAKMVMITALPLIVSALCLIIIRFGVIKSNKISIYKIKTPKSESSPEGAVPSIESDTIKPWVYYLLCSSVILYAISLCIFQLYIYEHYNMLSTSNDVFNAINCLQFIRFSSIQLYSLHRIVRPSNRIDPLRTIFDLDIVEICLDSLDSSALFQIIFVSNYNQLPYIIIILTKISVITWLLSVVIRICTLYLIHLPTSSYIWCWLLKYNHNYNVSHWFADKLDGEESKYYWSKPDSTKAYTSRSLIALRFRAFQHLLIIPAELIAITTRGWYLVSIGFSFVQIELLWKNMTGLWRTISAFELYQMYYFKSNKSKTNKCCRFLGCDWCCNIPTFTLIHVWCFVFCISYLLVGIGMNYIISISVKSLWPYSFTVFDATLIMIFLIWISKTYFIRDHTTYQSEIFSKLFPMIILLELNIGSYRFPLFYYTANNIWNLSVLSNILTCIVIIYYSFHETMKNVYLFNHEYWTLPKYEYADLEIKKAQVVKPCDPCHALTAQSAVSEGVLDVLSSVTFFVMSMNNNLDIATKQTCLAFSILELVNGGICFASSVMLYFSRVSVSSYLLGFKALSRVLRWFIDTGAFITRMIAWIQFGVIETPFMIKNLYHMIHAFVLMERAFGGSIKYGGYVPFNHIYATYDDWDKVKM